MKKKRLKRCIRDWDEEEFWGFRLCASFCWEEIEEMEKRLRWRRILGFWALYMFFAEKRWKRWRRHWDEEESAEMENRLRRTGNWRDEDETKTEEGQEGKWSFFFWTWKEAYSSVTRETLPLLGSCRPQYTPSQGSPQGSLPTQLLSLALGSKRAARNAFRTAAALQSINQSIHSDKKHIMSRNFCMYFYLSSVFAVCRLSVHRSVW
jgi:hypothetical protein